MLKVTVPRKRADEDSKTGVDGCLTDVHRTAARVWQVAACDPGQEHPILAKLAKRSRSQGEKNDIIAAENPLHSVTFAIHSFNNKQHIPSDTCAHPASIQPKVNRVRSQIPPARTIPRQSNFALSNCEPLRTVSLSPLVVSPIPRHFLLGLRTQRNRKTAVKLHTTSYYRHIIPSGYLEYRL